MFTLNVAAIAVLLMDIIRMITIGTRRGMRSAGRRMRISARVAPEHPTSCHSVGNRTLSEKEPSLFGCKAHSSPSFSERLPNCSISLRDEN